MTTQSSWRRLSGDGIAVLLHLGDPSGRCRAIEVMAKGKSLMRVVQRLRATGLEGVHRPERGDRPGDDELSALVTDEAVDFLWREWPDAKEWQKPDALLNFG